MRICAGHVVTMDYAVRLSSGVVVEKSPRGAPVQYLHGAGMLLPSLEEELENVEEGGRKRFVLAPRRAYGDRDEARILTLPRHLFQDDADLQPGARMAARMSDGDLHPLTVREVKDHRVVVDLNHPLAGQALHFDVVVHEVRPAGPAELFTGKPHEIERV